MRSHLKGKKRSVLLRCSGLNVPTPHGVAKTTMTIWAEVEVGFELPQEDQGLQEVGEGLDRRGVDRTGDRELEELLKTTASETAERCCEIIRLSARHGATACQAELDFSLSTMRTQG